MILAPTQIKARKRWIKLDQLVKSEGHDALEAFLDDNAHDSIVPGICLTETFGYTPIRPAPILTRNRPPATVVSPQH